MDWQDDQSTDQAEPETRRNTMELTIKSRTEGTFNFWMNEAGGYIFLESDGKPGTLGQQICKGGYFSGSTLSATPETFGKVCRNWYRGYMKHLAN